MLAVVIAEGVAIALLAVLVLGLLRSHALILRGPARARRRPRAREGGRGRGARARRPARWPCRSSPASCRRPGRSRARAHDVVGRRPAGAARAGRARGRGIRRRPTLLAFLTSGLQRLPDLLGGARARHRHPGGRPARGGRQGQRPTSRRATLQRLARPGVEVVASSAAWADYDIPGSPYFVLVEGASSPGRGRPPTGPACATCSQQAVDQSAHARAAAGRTGPGAEHVAGAAARAVDATT